MPKQPILRAEKLYRDFLLDERLVALLRESRRHLAALKDYLKLDRLPEQVALPGMIPYNLLLVELQRTGRLPDLTMLSTYTTTICWWAAYEQTRQTYRVRAELWQELGRLRWPAQTPAVALAYLPRKAFSLELPEGELLGVYYDLLTGQEETRALELRVVRFESHLAIPLLTLHLIGNLDLALQDALDTAVEHGFNPDMRKLLLAKKEVFSRLINLLLYIAGDQDVANEVAVETPLAKRHRKASEETQRRMKRPAKSADVGVRYAEALRIALEAEEKETPGQKTGRTVRPHVRRAHPHLYWTGPGRKIPRVRYLPTILVKGGGKQELPPTAQTVDQPRKRSKS